MEDFQAAFLQRKDDFIVLDETRRHVAAIHFGGITVECLLKSMISATLPTNAQGQKEWKTRDNQPGHTVYNPGHSYAAALRAHNKLKSRVDHFPQVKQWFEDVEEYFHCHFIDMRYIGKEPDEQKYKQWKKSYTNLVNWLTKQATTKG